MLPTPPTRAPRPSCGLSTANLPRPSPVKTASRPLPVVTCCFSESPVGLRQSKSRTSWRARTEFMGVGTGVWGRGVEAADLLRHAGGLDHRRRPNSSSPSAFPLHADAPCQLVSWFSCGWINYNCIWTDLSEAIQRVPSPSRLARLTFC